MIEIVSAVLFILAFEALLLGLTIHPRTAGWFSVLPAIFWMYFLPAVFSKLGLLNTPPSLSAFSSQWLMPLALILMVAPTHIRRLLHMGKTSFMALCFVYASMMAGGIVSFLLFKFALASDAWKAFAALAATWTGGTVNMLAVKEIVGLSESQFSVMVITDTFLSYGWMVLLMVAFRWSQSFDKWTRSNEIKLDEKATETKNHLSWFHPRDAYWLVGALILTGIAHFIGGLMPSSDSFPAKAWVLVAASILALLAAGGGWHKLTQTRFSDQAGFWLLYFVLMTMRAQADVMPGAQDFIVLGAGIIWLMVHGLLMLCYAKFFRVQLRILAIASQAAVGGVISAPVVAALYDPTLVTVAVLMGIFGTLIGTYLGLLMGYLIRFLS